MATTIAPEYAAALETHLANTVWSQTHSNIDTAWSYYTRNFALWPARRRNRPVYHSPRPTAIINHAVNTQLQFAPNVTVTPWSESEADGAKADRLEGFWKELLKQAFMREPMLTARQNWFYLMLCGYTNLEICLEWDPNGPKDKAAQIKAGWFPFRLRAWHPKTVLMDPRQKQPSEALVVRQRFVKEIQQIIGKRRAYGLSVPYDPQGNPYQKLKTRELWTPDVHYFEVDGVKAFQEPNTYGFQPFCQAFSGWGSESGNEADGPETLAVGLYEALMDKGNTIGAIKKYDQALSAKHNIIIERAFRGFVYKGELTELEEQLAHDGNVQGDPKDIGRLPPIEVDANLTKMSEEDAAEIEFGTYASDNGGYRQEGVSTVGQQRLLSNASAATFVAPNQQMNQLYTIAVENGMKLLRKMIALDYFEDGEIRVGSHKIRTSDVLQHCTVDVEFERKDLILQLQERQQGQSEVKDRLISRKEWRRRAGVVNETDMAAEIEDEDIDELPAVKMARQAALLKKKGEMEAAAIMEAEADKMMGMLPDGTTPAMEAGAVAQGPGEATVMGTPANTAQTTRQLNPPGMGGRNGA